MLKLKGVFSALVTPFNTDGSVDYGALRALIQWQISEGVAGVSPVGTTGESPTLSPSRRQAFTRARTSSTEETMFMTVAPCHGP